MSEWAQRRGGFDPADLPDLSGLPQMIKQFLTGASADDERRERSERDGRRERDGRGGRGERDGRGERGGCGPEGEHRRGPRGMQGKQFGGRPFGPPWARMFGGQFGGPGGPFGGPGGPFGGPGGPWAGKRRRGRGDVRLAILALLAEESRHGYQMIQEIEARSGGTWKPSPGSVYPTLQQLEDEGLIRAEEIEGRRAFRLTDEGSAYVAERSDEIADLWASVAPEPAQGEQLGDVIVGVATAFFHVTTTGTAAQREQAREILARTRAELYQVLGEDTTAASGDDSAPSDVVVDDEKSEKSEESGAGDSGVHSTADDQSVDGTPTEEEGQQR